MATGKMLDIPECDECDECDEADIYPWTLPGLRASTRHGPPKHSTTSPAQPMQQKSAARQRPASRQPPPGGSPAQSKRAWPTLVRLFATAKQSKGPPTPHSLSMATIQEWLLRRRAGAWPDFF